MNRNGVRRARHALCLTLEHEAGIDERVAPKRVAGLG